MTLRNRLETLAIQPDSGVRINYCENSQDEKYEIQVESGDYFVQVRGADITSAHRVNEEGMWELSDIQLKTLISNLEKRVDFLFDV